MSIKSLTRDYGNIVWTGKKRYLGLPISFTRYILTETKLHSRIGFFSIIEERVELYRVVDISLKLPFGQRIFGCGTIILHSRDKTDSKLELRSIKKPREVLRYLEDRVQCEREKYNIHGRDLIGSNMDIAVDIVDQGE